MRNLWHDPCYLYIHASQCIDALAAMRLLSAAYPIIYSPNAGMFFARSPVYYPVNEQKVRGGN